MNGLAYRERPAAAEPEGLLVLHHGRGADEHDLLGLADALDPDRRLHVVTPRAPVTLPGAPGYHWYVVPRVGHPDPATFHRSYGALGAFHDALWERTGLGPERTVLGGFSQGSVMSYALGLGPDRPAPAGLLVLSGFIPDVEGWQPALDARADVPVFIAHGTLDPVIGVDFGRRASARLREAGLEVDYHETPVAHQVDAAIVPLAAGWIEARLATGSPSAR